MFRSSRRPGERGQSLVEFSLVLVPFLILMMGVFDLGRAIYQMNGTAEAAREIARVTSVHPYSACCDLGSSSQAQAVVSTQRRLVPNLDVTTSTDVVCVKLGTNADPDVVIPDNKCGSGDYVRVRTRSAFGPITPIVSVFGNHTFESYSRIKIP